MSVNLHQVRQAQLYLRMLAIRAPRGALFDVRYRLKTSTDMGQFFLPTARADVAREIVKLGRRTDVYVGCVPRKRPGGTREDIALPRILWADCDDPSCLQTLAKAGAPPAMIVASGSKGHAHAYWLLTRPLRTSQLEQFNRILAEAVGADRKCANASRILRPPGTFNFKENPPGPVRLLRYEPDRRYDPDRLIALLAPDRPREPSVPARRRTIGYRERDPLQQIAPSEYVRVLTGRTPDRDGKIACPFHADDTPSLHVYPTPAQGWTCYGCETPDGKPLGGDIYTLASALWRIPTRGKAFIELRKRLDQTFGIRRETLQRPAHEQHRADRSNPNRTRLARTRARRGSEIDIGIDR